MRRGRLRDRHPLCRTHPGVEGPENDAGHDGGGSRGRPDRRHGGHLHPTRTFARPTRRLPHGVQPLATPVPTRGTNDRGRTGGAPREGHQQLAPAPAHDEHQQSRTDERGQPVVRAHQLGQSRPAVVARVHMAEQLLGLPSGRGAAHVRRHTPPTHLARRIDRRPRLLAQERLAHPLARPVQQHRRRTLLRADALPDGLQRMPLRLGQPQRLDPPVGQLPQHPHQQVDGGDLFGGVGAVGHPHIDLDPLGCRRIERRLPRGGGARRRREVPHRRHQVGGHVVDLVPSGEPPPHTEVGLGDEVFGGPGVPREGTRVRDEARMLFLVDPGVRGGRGPGRAVGHGGNALQSRAA